MNADQGGEVEIIHTAENQLQISKKGNIIRYLGELDGTGHMAQVLVKIPDPLGLKTKDTLPLLAGARVSVRFQGKPVENVFKIPRDALRANNNVYLLSKENRLTKKVIDTVWRDENTVWTRSLNEGDRLITSPIALPVEGMTLKAYPNPKAGSMSENKSQHSGAIAWMTRNSGSKLGIRVSHYRGTRFTSKVRQEDFPEFSLDIVTITVPYPGASPEEVEKGVVLAVEEAISGIEGIKTITGEASENAGVVYFDLERGTDVDRAVSDVKNAVDAIRTFPQDAEEPTVSIIQSKREVLSVVVYGQQTIQTLQAVGEKIRDSLSQKKKSAK